MSSQLTKLGLAALVALPAMAAPSHQHGHLHKRDMVYETAVVTITCTQGDTACGAGPTAGPVAGPVGGSPYNEKMAAPGPGPAHGPGQQWPGQPQNGDSNTPAQPTGGPTGGYPGTNTGATTTSAPGGGSSVGGSSAGGSSNGGTPTQGGGSGGNKKGLVYSKDSALYASATAIAAQASGSVSWFYNWEGYTAGGQDAQGNYKYADMEFVPMLHSCPGVYSAWTENWKSPTCNGMYPQGKTAQHALFYNEPNLPQWGCDAGDSASRYTSDFMAGVSDDTKLGGPVVSRGGEQWLEDFKKGCGSCRIDFQPAHFYSGPSEQDVTSAMKAFTDYMTDFISNHATFNGKKLPVWVTEFALDPENGAFTDDNRADFISQASKWMDGQSSIERYSPYGILSGGAASMNPGSAAAKAYVAA